MSIALFFITHEGIASSMLTIAEAIIQKPNDNLSYKEIPMDADIDIMQENIEDKLKQLNLNEGVLFISDLYGSTPGNIAQQTAKKHNAQLICGVNLPMVIRLLNYRNECKQTIVKKALDGALKGIQHNTTES